MSTHRSRTILALGTLNTETHGVGPTGGPPTWRCQRIGNSGFEVIHRFAATRCCERRRLPHSVGMSDRYDDETSETLLTRTEVVALQRAIEAGLLARDARASGTGFADATDQELRLLEDRGERARQRFIRANLGLVGMVSRQYATRSQLPDAELFQEGCVGLITAVERFDHARGYRFSTYALFWIRAFVGAATAKLLGAMNLPTSRAEQVRAAHGLEAELTQSLGRPPHCERWLTLWAAARIGRPVCSPTNVHGRSSLSTVPRWTACMPVMSWMRFSPSRSRCGNCCSAWTTWIGAFWSCALALPTASPGRTCTRLGCFRSR